MQSTRSIRTLPRVLRQSVLRAQLQQQNTTCARRLLHTTTIRREETISAADLTFGQPLHETHPHLLRPGEGESSIHKVGHVR